MTTLKMVKSETIGKIFRELGKYIITICTNYTMSFNLIKHNLLELEVELSISRNNGSFYFLCIDFFRIFGYDCIILTCFMCANFIKKSCYIVQDNVIYVKMAKMK